MPKRILHDKKLIILSIINIVLLISLIFITIKYCNNNEKEIVIKKNVYELKEGYDPSKVYYQKINYKQFKKMSLKDEVYNIAIIDNSSPTYNKFLELINKQSFYKNSNIYLLEISKLSKKEEILFYEFDDRLKELNSDFIITIKNKEIISIITFNTSYLNSIVDSISRGE